MAEESNLDTIPFELLMMIQESACNPFLHRTCRRLYGISGSLNYQTLAHGLFQTLPGSVQNTLDEDAALLRTYQEQAEHIIHQGRLFDSLPPYPGNNNDVKPSLRVTHEQLHDWVSSHFGKRVLLSPPVWTQRHGQLLCYLGARFPTQVWMRNSADPSLIEIRTRGLMSVVRQGCGPAIFPSGPILGQQSYKPSRSTSCQYMAAKQGLSQRTSLEYGQPGRSLVQFPT